MLRFLAKYKILWIALLGLSIVIVAIIYSILKPIKVLPIYQPNTVDTELVDSTIQHVKKYHTIADFELTNQNGKTITQEDYNDKIYIADFFFTTCQAICPIMTDHMLVLQKELKKDTTVLLLSHTVIPEVDTVAQLKKYALVKGVNDTKWNLVTGNKDEIYNLARKSYLAAKETGNPYDLVHTEKFVLIDTKNRIRGRYDGTNPKSIAKILEDIELLKAEQEKP